MSEGVWDMIGEGGEGGVGGIHGGGGGRRGGREDLHRPRQSQCHSRK